MPKLRLKKGDISLKKVLELSTYLYKKGEIDNKGWRAKADVKSAKIKVRRNIEYDRKQQKWIQTGREVKFQFTIKTKPESYKDTSGIDIHEYPVTFILKDLDAGMDSSFRWRTGSLRKPKFPKQKVSEGKDKNEKDRIKKANKKIAQQNIKSGIQMQFFFDLSYVLDKYNLLWGVNYARSAPDVRNPNQYVFFDKHAYWIVANILSKMLTDQKGFIRNKLFKNTPSLKDKVEQVVTPEETDNFVEIQKDLEKQVNLEDLQKDTNEYNPNDYKSDWDDLL